MEMPEEYFQYLELDVNGEHLTGIKVAKDLSKPADFVFLHGARLGSYKRIAAFAKPSIESGSSIVAFNHSGHGTSSGTEASSSLKKRFDEATAVINAFADGNPRTIMGSSMGGYNAIKMLEKYDIKNLILYCPGVYDRHAFEVQFDQGFTDMIRKENSWENTDAKEILETFKGNLLVVIGSEDTTIPKGVIELIDRSAMNTLRKEIMILPGAPHAINVWMQSHPDFALEVGKKVAEFSQ